jgi:hypothetical protein
VLENTPNGECSYAGPVPILRNVKHVASILLLLAAGEVEAGALVEAGNAWETGDDRFYMTVGKTF